MCLKWNKKYIILTLYCIGFLGCKQITKATDLIINPTPREVYAREFKNDSLNFPEWNRAYESALMDSLDITFPYVETGSFFSGAAPRVYSYNFQLSEGEVFHLDMRIDSLDTRIFISLFHKSSASSATFKEVAYNELNSGKLTHRVEQSGKYKLLIQPELYADSGFVLKTYTRPLYDFPVQGKDNSAIQSFWGASRAGGIRNHKGIDIFAERGTPVVAVTEGRIGFVGERGLGGKQVWLRAGLFGNSLYYAHLDSIAVSAGKRVRTGDTLGFVGNTGNARTTNPHLHFGIYQGYGGAIDPLPYVFESEVPDFPKKSDFRIPQTVVIKALKANLRNSASLTADKIGEAALQDSLGVLGKTGKWLHVTTSATQKAYVHISLVTETAGQDAI